jgi:hypothetical protein
MTPFTFLDYGLFGAGVYILNSYVKQRRLPAPLPPGPIGLPIIGVSPSLYHGSQAWRLIAPPFQ